MLKKIDNPHAIDLAEQAIYLQKQAKLAEEIKQKNPSLDVITALIMAGDTVGAERIDNLFQTGELSFETACNLIGSYARFDWAVSQFEAGKVQRKKFFQLLPELWSSSDPDDTDEKYLKVWEEARKAARKIICDDKPLPDKKSFLIYRGQDVGAKVGISWTLDYRIAEKFARGAWARVPRNGEVIAGTVDRKNVIAYITGRGEAELIIDPRHVTILGRVLGQPQA